MRHPTAGSSWFTFETSAALGFRVYGFSGAREMHRHYGFEIELVPDPGNLDFATLPGRAASLSIQDKSGGIRHMHGGIHRFIQLHSANQRTHYRCLLVPRLHFLNQVKTMDHFLCQDIEAHVNLYEEPAYQKVLT
ncbi:MAG: contractile injection system protein, VgrG/Pvc8 family [Desulfomicrobium apsheronum]|nr:contractile injection system protein, VgrG/Pvc8 family [Desulfomicrobium apsheronum]